MLDSNECGRVEEEQNLKVGSVAEKVSHDLVYSAIYKANESNLNLQTSQYRLY